MQSLALNFVGPNSFSIKPASLTTTGAKFVFEYTHRVWASAKVNFWVSSNPQIQVGFVHVGTSSLIQPSFKLATHARTARQSTLILCRPLEASSTPSSESSSTASTWIEEVVPSKFQLPPPTFRGPSSPSRSPWAKRPSLIKYASAGSPSPLVPPVSYPTEVRSPSPNSQEPSARTSALPSTSPPTLSTVSTLSRSSPARGFPSPQRSPTISSSRSAHPSPLTASPWSTSQLEPTPPRSAPTVELRISSTAMSVWPPAQLALLPIPTKTEVSPAGPALKPWDSSSLEASASKDQPPRPPQQPPPL